MGFRFRKSFGKGVRINVGKRGVSFGAGAPGTGVSYNTGIFRWGRKRQQPGENEPPGCLQPSWGCAILFAIFCAVAIAVMYANKT